MVFQNNSQSGGEPPKGSLSSKDTNSGGSPQESSLPGSVPTAHHTRKEQQRIERARVLSKPTQSGYVQVGGKTLSKVQPGTRMSPAFQQKLSRELELRKQKQLEVQNRQRRRELAFQQQTKYLRLASSQGRTVQVRGGRRVYTPMSQRFQEKHQPSSLIGMNRSYFMERLRKEQPVQSSVFLSQLRSEQRERFKKSDILMKHKSPFLKGIREEQKYKLKGKQHDTRTTRKNNILSSTGFDNNFVAKQKVQGLASETQRERQEIKSPFERLIESTPCGKKLFIPSSFKKEKIDPVFEFYAAPLKTFVFSPTRGVLKILTPPQLETNKKTFLDAPFIPDGLKKITKKTSSWFDKQLKVEGNIIKDPDVQNMLFLGGLGALSYIPVIGSALVGAVSVPFAAKAGKEFIKSPSPTSLAHLTLTSLPVVHGGVKYSPFKGVKFELPVDGGSKVFYKGVGVDVAGKSQPLFGFKKGGRPVVGTPKIDFIKEGVEFGKIKTGTDFYVQSGLQTKIFRKNIKGVFPEKELLKFDLMRSISKRTEFVKSRFVRDKFTRDVKYAEPVIVEEFLKFGREKKGSLYGSYVQEAQLPKGVGRKPADIDVEFNVLPDKIPAVSKELLGRFKKHKTKYDYFIDTKKPSLIQARVGKEVHHAIDIHSSFENPDLSLTANKVYGLRLGQKPQQIEGIKVMPLSEQGIRKGAHSLLAPRSYKIVSPGMVKKGLPLEKSVFEEGLGFSPEKHRLKDVYDFFVIQKEGLLPSKKNIFSAKKGFVELEELKGLYPKEIFEQYKTSVVKIPFAGNIKSKSFSSLAFFSPGVIKGVGGSLGLISSPGKFPSLSVSPSLSPGVSPGRSPYRSPSRYPSPSVSPGRSPYRSLSKYPSVSAGVSPVKSSSPSKYSRPSRSPSPSPIMSPSIPSRSPSKSPSPSVSPVGSLGVKPKKYPSRSPSPSKSPSPSDSLIRQPPSRSMPFFPFGKHRAKISRDVFVSDLGLRSSKVDVFPLADLLSVNITEVFGSGKRASHPGLSRGEKVGFDLGVKSGRVEFPTLEMRSGLVPGFDLFSSKPKKLKVSKRSKKKKGFDFFDFI